MREGGPTRVSLWSGDFVPRPLTHSLARPASSPQALRQVVLRSCGSVAALPRTAMWQSERAEASEGPAVVRFADFGGQATWEGRASESERVTRPSRDLPERDPAEANRASSVAALPRRAIGQSERAEASEPRERSATCLSALHKRQVDARERVRESEGRSPSVNKWCRGAELNCRHRDFQSRALPTELPRHWQARAQRTNSGF